MELTRPKIESCDPIFFTGTWARLRVSENDLLFPRGSEFGPNPEIPSSPIIQLRPRPVKGWLCSLNCWSGYQASKFQIEWTCPFGKWIVKITGPNVPFTCLKYIKPMQLMWKSEICSCPSDKSCRYSTCPTVISTRLRRSDEWNFELWACYSSVLWPLLGLLYRWLWQPGLFLVILNFAKAFDTMPHESLLGKLKYYGIDSNINQCQWVRAFLTNRSQEVIGDGSRSDQVAVTSGVPQGTVLGPLNDDKTELLIITTREELSKISDISIKVGDQSISPSDDPPRNLGVIFHSICCLDAHIAKLCRSINFNLYSVGKIRNVQKISLLI